MGTWVPGLRPGLQMQTRLPPDRPERCLKLPQPLCKRKQSFVCDHVMCCIYVCHVGSLRTSACQRFWPLGVQQPTGDRKETKRPDPVPDDNETRLRLLPVHCLLDLLFFVDSQSIIVVYHAPCCFVLLDLF